MTMLQTRIVQFLAAAVIAVLPIGTAFADVTELNVLGPDKDFPRVSRSYPSMNATFSRNGVKREISEVRKVAIGIDKRQLVNAIGRPVSAFNDGSWNYNLALRLPQGNRLICQYRVYFDNDERVSGSVWRRPQCVNLATGKSR